MTRHIRKISGLALVALGVVAVGTANGITPPTPHTGRAVTTIQLPRITITDAAGVTHTVDLGALTAQAVTDSGLAASLGVGGGSVLGTALPTWTVDTGSGDHDISLTAGQTAADIGLVGYDVNAAGQSAHASLTALTGTASSAPLDVDVDLGQHGVNADVEPDTSTSTVNLTVTGLRIDLGDLLPTDVLDALPLSSLLDIVSGLGVTVPAGGSGVLGRLSTLTGDISAIEDAAAQLGDAQTMLAGLLAAIPATSAAQQQLTDAQTQLATDLAALQSAQQQLGVDTTSVQTLTAQLASANADVTAAQQQLDDANNAVTYWTGQVNTLTTQLSSLLADPLQAVLAAQVAAQLQSAQDSLSAAQADVTSAQSALAAAQNVATQLQTQLDQANSDVTADQQLVTTIQQEVASDQAAVTAAQSTLDGLAATVAAANQAVADAQATVDQLTSALNDVITTTNTDLAALPDLATLRSQLIAALTSAPLLDIGTLGATLSSTAADDAGSGVITCTVTGVTVLGQPIPVGTCADLVDHFTFITNALSGALALLPTAAAIAPAVNGLTPSATLTTPGATDVDTTGAAGLTALHLGLPAATLTAVTDAAVSGLTATLAPAQQALNALGLPVVTSALVGSLGTLNTSLAALPSGAALAGLRTIGVDVSAVGLATSALHHRSLPTTPPATGGTGTGGPSTGGTGTGGGGTGRTGTGGGGTVSDPADPPSAPGQPRGHDDPPASPQTPVTQHAPQPALPFTGDRTAVDLATGLLLALVGSHLLLAGRRRPQQ